MNRLETIEFYDFNEDDLAEDIISTEEDEPPTKFGVWHIYTKEFLEICDTKEEAEEAMQDFRDNDFDENGCTHNEYEIKEV